MEITNNNTNNEVITKAEFARRVGIKLLGGKSLSRAWATNFFKKNSDLVNDDGKVDYLLSVDRYQTTKDATRNAQRAASEKRRGVDQIPKPRSDEASCGLDDKTRDRIFSDILSDIRRMEVENKLNPNKVGELVQREQLVKAMFDSKMAELKYYRELGRSADIEDIIAANAQITTAIRSKLLAHPSKVAPKLFGKTIHEIESRLLDAVNEILTELNGLSIPEAVSE
jgi:hypothetical protein